MRMITGGRDDDDGLFFGGLTPACVHGGRAIPCLKCHALDTTCEHSPAFGRCSYCATLKPPTAPSIVQRMGSLVSDMQGIADDIIVVPLSSEDSDTMADNIRLVFKAIKRIINNSSEAIERAAKAYADTSSTEAVPTSTSPEPTPTSSPEPARVLPEPAPAPTSTPTPLMYLPSPSPHQRPFPTSLMYRLNQRPTLHRHPSPYQLPSPTLLMYFPSPSPNPLMHLPSPSPLMHLPSPHPSLSRHQPSRRHRCHAYSVTISHSLPRGLAPPI